MAILDMQEQQQVDAFKAWWKANGKWVLMALALILAGILVTQGWQSYRKSQAVEASIMYDEVERQLASNDAKRVNDATTALIERFGSSAYAPRAALLAAQANITVNDPARAKTQLQWVIDHADETALQSLARLKLAALLLDEKDYDAALKLLEASHPEAFDGLYADLKGDVKNAQGKTEEARALYQQAFDKIEPGSSYRSMISAKLDGLGGRK